MLAFRRSLVLRGAPIERTGTFRIGEGFRVYAVEMRGGIVFDGHLLAGARGPAGELPYAARSNVVFVLSGAFRLRRGTGEIVLGPGQAVLEPVSSWDERWEGDPFHAVVVEWAAHRATPVTTTTVLAPSRRLLRLATEVAETLGRPRGQPQDLFVANATFRILSALGIAHGGATPDDAAAHPFQAEADLLGAAVSRLDAQPMWVDLAGPGLSERALRRRFGALPLGDRPGFRATLHRHRLVSSLTLLSAPTLSVGAVARVLGYGTTRALGTALEHAGLPSATEIQRRLRR